MDRSDWPVRKYRLGEEPELDPDVLAMSMDERLALMWPLTLQAWSAMPGFKLEPMRRDLVTKSFRKPK